MKWSLRRRIEQFLKRTRISPTRMGLDVAGDPQLVFMIRRGRVPRRPMEARITAYMDGVDLGSEGRSPPPRPRR